jgi:hypothetical protein
MLPDDSTPERSPFRFQADLRPPPAPEEENLSNHAAALAGASHSFAAKPRVVPRPLVNTYSGRNGALAAATKAGVGPTSSNSLIGRQQNASAGSTRNSVYKGNGDQNPTFHATRAAAQASIRSESHLSDRGLAKATSASSLLGSEDNAGTGSTKGASNIAAMLAVARFTPQNTGNSTARKSPVASSQVSRASSVASDRGLRDGLPILGTAKDVRSSIPQLNQCSTPSKPTPGDNASLSPGRHEQATDDTSIPPTTTLIGLFERKQTIRDPAKARAVISSITSTSPPVNPPRLVLPITPTDIPLASALKASRKDRYPHNANDSHGPSLSMQNVLPTTGVTSGLAISGGKKVIPIPPKSTVALAVTNSTSSSSTKSIADKPNLQPLVEAKSTPPPPPPARRSQRVADPSPISRSFSSKSDVDDGKSSEASFKTAPEKMENSPVNSFRRISTSSTRHMPPSGASSIRATPETSTPKIRSSRHVIHKPILGQAAQRQSIDPVSLGESGSGENYEPSVQSRSRRASAPGLTEDSLADAMVASALASSRAPSPSKIDTPLHRRPSRGHLFPFHHHSPHHDARTPSPVKGMRQTLRREQSSSSDEEESKMAHRKGKKHRIKKHPNKHSEGTRKRWRDKVTERERKRYEGIWAANKGLYVFFSAGESSKATDTQSNNYHTMIKEDVCSLVVRDIWSRSRLETDILEEVWDLVDDRGVGRLDRAQFVVGMWLIDQRLKGRKLPLKVSESVWASVKPLGGVKIPKYKG